MVPCIIPARIFRYETSMKCKWEYPIAGFSEISRIPFCPDYCLDDFTHYEFTNWKRTNKLNSERIVLFKKIGDRVSIKVTYWIILCLITPLQFQSRSPMWSPNFNKSERSFLWTISLTPYWIFCPHAFVVLLCVVELNYKPRWRNVNK